VCACVHACVRACVHACVHVCMCEYLYLCFSGMYMCVSVFVSSCIHTCVYSGQNLHLVNYVLSNIIRDILEP